MNDKKTIREQTIEKINNDKDIANYVSRLVSNLQLLVAFIIIYCLGDIVSNYMSYKFNIFDVVVDAVVILLVIVLAVFALRGSTKIKRQKNSNKK